MSFVSDFIGDLTGANKQADAANAASKTQAASAQAGIDEYRRQFDALQKLLQPFVSGGTNAMTALSNLIGLGGSNAQASAVSEIQNSPEFTAALQSGENAIRQNASATGGLRGGNTQAALAQFSPQLLAQTINNQYSRLGNLASLGQNAAAGVGNAGLSTGSGISNLLQQKGAALAGGQLAQGNAAAANTGTGTGLLINGLTSFLTGGLGGFSDRRLKTNIVHIGTTERGNRKYRWDWIDGSGSAEGVIADEVAHIPGAVHQHESGFLMVDYSKV
jgi:hypothetical protein